jgi:hypothetical protein
LPVNSSPLLQKLSSSYSLTLRLTCS